MGLKDLKIRSDDALAQIAAQKTTVDDRPIRATTAPGATAFMQPTIDALNDRAKKAEALAAEYRLKLEQAPIELPLDSLIEVPHRRRRLTPEQFDELKGNLANNPLIHPITVQRVADGRFEIISGHNRAEVYRSLGRTLIPVVVMELESDHVDRSAFYTNLLQPSLSDFEKYLGFKAERDRTGHSQKQMAKDAGVSESIISMLFSFDHLPEEALLLVERRPEVVGMTCVAEMAKLCRAGRKAEVTEAIGQLIEGRLTQKEAIRLASRKVALAAARPSAQAPVRVRVGRLEFCQYQSRGTSLRIEFRSEDQRKEAEAVIADALQELARRNKDA